MSYQIYLLYRCNIHTIILFTKYFLFNSRSGSRRALLPRGRPTAYVSIVVLVGGGGGVIVAPAVVAKIARPAPAFAVGRSDAASRPPRHRVRRPVERPRRLIPCLPLAPPLVLRRRNVIGQHTLLDAGELGLGARGGYLPRSSRKHGDHGALPPPCPKSCQNMTRTRDTSAKKNISVQLWLVCVDSTQRMIKKHVYSLKKHTFCQHAR